MSKQANKLPQRSSQPASAGPAQLRSIPSTAQLVDNRPLGIAQRKMQAVASGSQKVTQLQAIVTRRAPAQRKSAPAAPLRTAPVSGTVQRKLMSEKKFRKKSGSIFSGKRNEILKVEAALAKCATASSKSVAYNELINVCNNYLSVPGRDKTRAAGVQALLTNATQELAAWRNRPRQALPGSVFRMDERTPETISGVGFQAWNGAGNITLIEHVTQALRQDRADAPTGESGKIGMGAKKHSQFVSTAADLNFAKDPTLLAGLLNKYFYKIDTGAAPNTYTDVNKHFDDNNEANPYEPQFEFAKTGGIPGSHVTHYVHGRDLVDFVVAGTDASTWNIPWRAMP